MKTYKLEPKGYDGFVEMKLPNYIERLELVQEANFTFEKTEDGKAEVVINNESIGFIISVLKSSKKYVKRVELKKGKEEYKSYDELLDGDCATACNEIVGLLVNGVQLGEA
jgi:hypothetical protein